MWIRGSEGTSVRFTCSATESSCACAFEPDQMLFQSSSNIGRRDTNSPPPVGYANRLTGPNCSSRLLGAQRLGEGWRVMLRTDKRSSKASQGYAKQRTGMSVRHQRAEVHDTSVPT